MTTKQCPNCKSTALVELSTYFKKICAECGQHIYWPLDEGQVPLHSKTKKVNKP